MNFIDLLTNVNAYIDILDSMVKTTTPSITDVNDLPLTDN